MERGHTVGPFLIPPFHDLHCSPIGAIIKKDDTCRLIMDLSQPKGCDINSDIDKEEFAIHYTHFDRATDMVFKAGNGCLMSKVDIKHAFRLMPISPSDWNLLGYTWEDCLFVDVVLSFGLRSSPGIFGQFADLICWVLQTIHKLKSTIHYADDFFLVSSKLIEIAHEELERLCAAFEALRIPLAKEKLEGPSTRIIYLGIEINSVDQMISIPQET